MKKTLMLLAAMMMTFTMAACSSGSNTNGSDPAQATKEADKPAVKETDKPVNNEPVTLKFFTALADRTNGAGKVEQDIIDAYMKENSNVKIEVEALQDEAYKAKIKVYASTKEIPDIIQSWGQSSFIKPLIDNGMLLELDPAEFADSKFVPGAMDGFMQDGKVYGVPRSADFLVLYYNKKIFADNNVQVPGTLAELLEASKQLRAKGINPITTNAMEGWSLPIWYEYAAQRYTGDFNKVDSVLKGEGTFSGNADFLAAASDLLALAENKALADGFLTADYGTSRNLFGQGQAAMYIMGNWEAGLAGDENFPAEVRDHIAAISYPTSDNGKATDVAAWFGGGYSVSSNSKQAEASIAFLKYFFKPENWAKQVWQNGAGTPAQTFTDYLTGQESPLQKQLVDIFGSITTSSGTPMHDMGTDEFKTKVMEAHQKLLSKQMTAEQFLAELDASVALIK